MQINELKKGTGVKSARRIGRGGKRGKTSGRGHKGQKARAGHSIRPAERDIIKRIPKRRGHGVNRSRTVNSGRVRPATVNLKDLEVVFEAGAAVNPKELVAKKLVNRRAGKVPAVKILAQGTLTKKLSVSLCTMSEAAREAIAKAGGEVL